MMKVNTKDIDSLFEKGFPEITLLTLWEKYFDRDRFNKNFDFEIFTPLSEKSF